MELVRENLYGLPAGQPGSSQELRFEVVKPCFYLLIFS
jgi:hypothetical protein